jgi:hypothetical protein
MDSKALNRLISAETTSVRVNRDEDRAMSEEMLDRTNDSFGERREVELKSNAPDKGVVCIFAVVHRLLFVLEQ